MHYFSHVLLLSVFLSSIASCFVTFMQLYGFFVPPWSSLIIFMFLRWSILDSCTLCQSWQKGGEIVEKMWFLFKILHVKGRNTCPCKVDLCFILLGRVFTSLWPCLHTLCLFLIYICDVCLLHLPLHVLFLLSLYTHVFLLYAIFYFCFTIKCLDEFCFKCFRNTGCQSLLAINSLLVKSFKSLC